MASSTPSQVINRGLILSASEIKNLTNWPETMVEDYLNILENLLTLASILDEKNNILKTIVDVSSSPYNIPTTAEDIFFDTTAGDIVATLPVGEEGRNFRLISVGAGGNKVILNPNGSELLFGVNAEEYIYDAEALIVTFSPDYGWN